MLLLLFAWTDHRRQEVLLLPLIGAGIVGLIMHVWMQEQSVFGLLAGGAIGVFLLFYGRMTRGKRRIWGWLSFYYDRYLFGILEKSGTSCDCFSFGGLLCRISCRGKKEDEGGTVPVCPVRVDIVYIFMVLVERGMENEGKLFRRGSILRPTSGTDSGIRHGEWNQSAHGDEGDGRKNRTSGWRRLRGIVLYREQKIGTWGDMAWKLVIRGIWQGALCVSCRMRSGIPLRKNVCKRAG